MILNIHCYVNMHGNAMNAYVWFHKLAPLRTHCLHVKMAAQAPNYAKREKVG